MALYAKSLKESSAAIARGEISARELAEAQLAHIARVDPAVEAWATLDPDHVYMDASRCDRSRVHGAIAGVGVGVKDVIDTADLPTELGCAMFAGRRPNDDATCVARIKEAGGYVFGKTVTTAFAFLDPGKTHNPWHAGHTPGGSSSGSAAAVATAQVSVALGTQTNGSVIRPAAFCGVVGFKPTRGWAEFDGIFVFSETFDTLGTFTRSVADAACIAAVLAEAGRISTTTEVLTHAPRLAYLPEFLWTRLERDGADALQSAASRLREAGAEVTPVELPEALKSVNLAHRTIMLFEGAQRLAPIKVRDPDRMPKHADAALEEGRAITPIAYRAALDERRVAIDACMRWLAPYDAILCPAANGAAPVGLESTGDPGCCTLWSFVGFPAIAIPAAVDKRGMPLGVQLATIGGADNRLLSVAQWCETCMPFSGLV